MSTDWRNRHAVESKKALDHDLVKGVMDELFDNLVNNCGVRKDDALVRYGISKVAGYAAQVARAQAMGFDPEALRCTDAEADAHMLAIAEACVKHGKPVTVIVDRGERKAE